MRLRVICRILAVVTLLIIALPAAALADDPGATPLNGDLPKGSLHTRTSPQRAILHHKIMAASTIARSTRGIRHDLECSFTAMDGRTAPWQRTSALSQYASRGYVTTSTGKASDAEGALPT